MPSSSPLKVIIDTNLWISFLIGKQLANLKTKTVGLIIESQSTISVCRDPKDNFLLAIAKDAQADFLITGDQDLLVVNTFESTKITTYREFLSVLGLREEIE